MSHKFYDKFHNPWSYFIRSAGCSKFPSEVRSVDEIKRNEKVLSPALALLYISRGASQQNFNMLSARLFKNKELECEWSVLNAFFADVEQTYRPSIEFRAYKLKQCLVL